MQVRSNSPIDGVQSDELPVKSARDTQSRKKGTLGVLRPPDLEEHADHPAEAGYP